MQDSDYENPDEHSDSEMYVLPAEEAGDDSYEPPPAEQETRTVHPALPFTRGEYVGESLPDLGHSAFRAAGSRAGQGCRVAGGSTLTTSRWVIWSLTGTGAPCWKACPLGKEGVTVANWEC